MNDRAPNRRNSYWRLVARAFLKKRLSMAAVVVVAILIFTAVAAPYLAEDKPIIMKRQGRLFFPSTFDYPEFRFVDWPQYVEDLDADDWALLPPVQYSPIRPDLARRLEAPSRDHRMGTDDKGRDVLARMIWGSRISLSVGFVAVGIALAIGTVLGALAGYCGGKVDIVISRVIEIVICFPVFFLILTIIALVPRMNIYYLMFAIGIVGWTGIARLIRGEFLKLREQEFVVAARALGVGPARIIFRHIMPNAISPVLVSATFGIAGAILTESALSFLGFGVAPPTPSWGAILALAREYVYQAWWLTVFPGTAIFVSVLCYNLIGEGLRDAADPRLKT